MQTKTTKISTGKLTQAMVERFKIDGFLLVEDFFSHEELDRFGSEVDKAVRYRTVDDNRSHEEYLVLVFLGLNNYKTKSFSNR